MCYIFMSNTIIMNKLFLVIILIASFTGVKASPMPLSFSPIENRSLQGGELPQEASLAHISRETAKKTVQFTSSNILIFIALIAVYVLFVRRGQSRNMRL